MIFGDLAKGIAKNASDQKSDGTFTLRATNWFEMDDELPQKWIGGMKLDPLVYEKK